MTPGAALDAVVIGLGGMGSAALYHLARDGARVLGIEQFEVDHDRGSSHGPSRAIRTLYRDPVYTELVLAAIPMWRALEAATDDRLLHLTGTLYYSRGANADLVRSLALFDETGLVREELDPDTLARRLPQVRIPDDATAHLFPGTGFLDASRCVRAHIRGAHDAGADVLEGTRVRRIDREGDQPVVVTDRGTFAARRVIVTTGAWGPELLAELRLTLRATRQEKHFFRPAVSHPYGPDRLPVFCDFDTLIYGFPFHEGAIGIAEDVHGPETTPDTMDRRPTAAERDRLGRWLAEFLPGAELTHVGGVTCLYPTTPDYHFCIGFLPGGQDVVAAVGLEHGFKFATLVGRILADLALEGQTPYRIEPFRLDRFA